MKKCPQEAVEKWPNAKTQNLFHATKGSSALNKDDLGNFCLTNFLKKKNKNPSVLIFYILHYPLFGTRRFLRGETSLTCFSMNLRMAFPMGGSRGCRRGGAERAFLQMLHKHVQTHLNDEKPWKITSSVQNCTGERGKWVTWNWDGRLSWYVKFGK